MDLPAKELSDPFLVNHISKQLDRKTLEQWEISIAASTEFPTYKQLEKFLLSRIRALERIEISTKHIGGYSTQPQKNTSHTVTQSTSKPASYQCDCCSGNHFIVASDMFKTLSSTERCNLAEEAWLCYNFLGRHTVHACCSTKRCKLCNGSPHSMLHDSHPAVIKSKETQGSSSAQ